MKKELLDNILLEKNIVEELIKIDNDKMNVNRSFEYYYEKINNLNIDGSKDILLDNNSLFIIEGEPLITLAILSKLKNIEYNVIIFINQGFIGMNKWFMEHFYKIVGNRNVELDVGINYNEYINEGYKVYPIGEDGLINQVMEDFNE